MIRVLIGAPLRQKPHIFAEHLKAINALQLPKGVEVSCYYVANNCDADTLALLDESEYEVRDDLAPEDYSADNNADHVWTNEDMVRMGELRSVLTDKVLYGPYDYLLSVDSDIVMKPETLSLLLNAKRQIVSEIFWTQSDSGFIWSNAWTADGYAVRKSDLLKWRTAGLYEVGMTGALTLIHRSVFEAGVSYRKIPNINTALIGEDRHFCVRAACAGIPMYIDTHAPAVHLYREIEYALFMKGKTNGDC